jgi:hypothetical protein
VYELNRIHNIRQTSTDNPYNFEVHIEHTPIGQYEESKSDKHLIKANFDDVTFASRIFITTLSQIEEPSEPVKGLFKQQHIESGSHDACKLLVTQIVSASSS